MMLELECDLVMSHTACIMYFKTQQSQTKEIGLSLRIYDYN